MAVLQLQLQQISREFHFAKQAVYVYFFFLSKNKFTVLPDDDAHTSSPQSFSLQAKLKGGSTRASPGSLSRRGANC